MAIRIESLRIGIITMTDFSTIRRNLATSVQPVVMILYLTTGLLPSACTVADEPHRSPVDLVLSPGGDWLVTVNQTSNSVSLVDVLSGRVLDEVSVGRHPSKAVLTPDGESVLISSEWSGSLHVLQVTQRRLREVGRVDIGFQPCGLAVTSDSTRAFVGLVATGEVAEVDLNELIVRRRIPCGNWPRYLTLTPDDSKLAIGCAGDERIIVIETASGDIVDDPRLTGGINFGHMQTSSDGKYAYFPWMVYRNNPITVGNIRLGWVLASRIGRVRLDEPAYREAISLDVPRMAVADPHGLVISRDGNRLVVSSSGTHELLVYRLKDLPFIGVGGPGDLIDRKLLNDKDLFYRIETGGRPMGLQFAADNRTVFVANHLNDSVQVVDIAGRRLVKEIHLGGPATKSRERLGMEIFYDAQRSLDQWYSCHSCHQDGGVNSRPMDTFNDGSPLTPKAVPPLYSLDKTGPWTWHGWQEDLNDAMHKSLTQTMLGKEPGPGEAEALLAYLKSQKAPPNPFVADSEGLTAAASRGRRLFNSSKTACAECHNGNFFTDGRIHDVGLNSKSDKYEGYNTPALRHLYRKVRFLHNGRARSLERVLTDLHSPEKVTGNANLSDDEVQDLIAYLKTL